MTRQRSNPASAGAVFCRRTRHLAARVRHTRHPAIVIPAEAGIHVATVKFKMGPRFRGDDELAGTTEVVGERPSMGGANVPPFVIPAAFSPRKREGIRRRSDESRWPPLSRGRRIYKTGPQKTLCRRRPATQGPSPSALRCVTARDPGTKPMVPDIGTSGSDRYR